MDKSKIDAIAFSGDLYDPNDPAIMRYQEKQKHLLVLFNRLDTTPRDTRRKLKLLPRIFGAIGEQSWVEPPLHANFGCKHVFVGKGFYANSNLTLVDDGRITIGDHVMIGPNVTIVTAQHPVSPELRYNWLQYNSPVTIGDNVWLGAGVTVLPGVTIGAGSIVGAGSVVTRDIPQGVVAFGNPCRVHRAIDRQDYVVFDHNRPIPQQILDKYGKNKKA